MVQKQGEISSYVDETRSRTISRLQDFGNSGVVLATLREDGVMEAELLTRLPGHISQDYNAQLVHKPGTDPLAARRIFLGPRRQESFATFLAPFAETTEREDLSKLPQLPLVMERDRSTIPTVRLEGQRFLEHGGSLFDGSRKRSAVLDEGPEAKRTHLSP